MDADPAASPLDEALQRVLLLGREVEGGEVQLDDDIVAGQAFVREGAAVPGEVRDKAVLTSDRGKHRLRLGTHGPVVSIGRGHDQHPKLRGLSEGERSEGQESGKHQMARKVRDHRRPILAATTDGQPRS